LAGVESATAAPSFAPFFLVPATARDMIVLALTSSGLMPAVKRYKMTSPARKTTGLGQILGWTLR
jgi:hypothetical protein